MWNPEEKFHEYLATVDKLPDDPSEAVSQVSMIHCCLEHGWIQSRLKLMDVSIDLTISGNYSPFFDQVKWLERIVEGGSPATWWFDDELRDHYFRATVADDEMLTLQYMRRSYPNVEAYISAKVSKRQLVLDCCYGLKHMIEIDREQSHELTEQMRMASATDIYADLQFHGRAEDAGGEAIWFEIDPETDEVIHPDLSRITGWLRSTAGDVTPGEARLLGLDVAG